MTVRAYREIVRRQSRKIRVGSVEVGGDAPISVQSMTNTLTQDTKATIAQVRRLEEAPGLAAYELNLFKLRKRSPIQNPHP